MQRKAWHAAGDDVGAGLDLAAGRDPALVEFPHVVVTRYELRAILRRQLGDPWHAVVAGREVLDLPVAGQDAVAHVAREVDEVGIADDAIILELSLRGAPAHATPFVVHGGIHIDASSDSIRHPSIELPPIVQPR